MRPLTKRDRVQARKSPSLSNGDRVWFVGLDAELLEPITGDFALLRGWRVYDARDRQEGGKEMKQMLLLAMLMAFSQPVVYSAQRSKAEQQIRKLDDQRIAAILKRDIPMLDRLMADDFTYTHQGGVTETKAEFLDEMSAGKGAFQSLHLSEVTVRILGGAAILTGRCDITAEREGRDFAIPTHFTEVYSRTARHWQWLLWQSTRLPEHSPA
jgi:ketosteroid isomerase-like protein